MKYLLLLVPVLLLISCKKDSKSVNQDEIYQVYEISFNESSGYTVCIARFTHKSENGKPLKLSEGSTITVNGESMDPLGKAYTKSYKGYATSATFIFTDADGKEYSNTILSEESIQNDPSTHLGSDGIWKFAGSALNFGETISATISSYQEDGGIAYGSTTELGASFLKIPMSGLTGGSATAITKRSSLFTSGFWTKAGGQRKSEYISDSKDITF